MAELRAACVHEGRFGHNFKNILWFSTGLFAGLARLLLELLVPITCPSHPPSFAVTLLLFPLMPWPRFSIIKYFPP